MNQKTETNINSDYVLSLLKQVTVDCKDDGKAFQTTQRIDAIKSFLEDTSWKLLAEKDLFLLYGSRELAEDQPVVLISSHIDCVYTQCFCTETETCYQGTFDNSFTNAAILECMKNGQLPSNVVVAFTGDEEKDSSGAVALIIYLTRKHVHIRFALVLDVTNEGWETQRLVALENDFGIDLFTAHRIVEAMKPYEGCYAYLHDAAPDETWDYDELGIPALTLSAPVGGNMHGNEGVSVRKDTFPAYCEVLQKLAAVL